MRTLRFSLLIIPLLALILSACQGNETTTQEPFVVADLFATPGKALATIMLTETPTPTATIPNVPSPTPVPTLPLPTVSILQQPTLPIATFGPQPSPTSPLDVNGTPIGTTVPSVVSCTTIPSMPFTPVWQNITDAQTQLRCPTGDVMQVQGVWQTFEHGWMFWRQADKSVFVVSELRIRQGQPSDVWWRIDDTWVEGEPDSDPGLQPPTGLRQPLRGFGKVWRNNGFVREALGWATSEELGVTISWQQFELGWMMSAPNNAPVYVMIPYDGAPHTNGGHLGPKP